MEHPSELLTRPGLCSVAWCPNWNFLHLYPPKRVEAACTNQSVRKIVQRTKAATVLVGEPPSRTPAARWLERGSDSKHGLLSRPQQHRSRSPVASSASPAFGVPAMALRSRAEGRPLYRRGSHQGMIHWSWKCSQGAAGDDGCLGWWHCHPGGMIGQTSRR